MNEYSIEQRTTQIFDARTKEYFAEVLSCYAAGKVNLAFLSSLDDPSAGERDLGS